MKSLKYILFIFCLLFAYPIASYGAGISVSPSSLDVEATINVNTSTAITVSNPTQDVSVIEVYPDDFQSSIYMEPRSFTLEPGSKKEVKIFMTFGDVGKYSLFISAVAMPLGNRTLNTGSGIKIPLKVSVKDNNNATSDGTSDTRKENNLMLWGIVLLDIVLFVVLVALVVGRIRKNKKKREV